MHVLVTGEIVSMQSKYLSKACVHDVVYVISQCNILSQILHVSTLCHCTRPHYYSLPVWLSPWIDLSLC